ncbi:hypothetical protein [Dapis sp. BLCC M229]|uniref:hypothetical protein n=1 Tax=Dapis sp. BLCC M229 TaxID=3400188 RepID=UPI003CF50836
MSAKPYYKPLQYSVRVLANLLAAINYYTVNFVYLLNWDEKIQKKSVPFKSQKSEVKS